MDFFKIIRVYTHLFIYCTIIYSSLLGVNIPHIPGFPPAVLLPVDHAFNNLLACANQQPTTNLLVATDNLEDSLFLPIDITAIPDQTSLLPRLRAIRNSLNGSDPLINPLLKNLKELVSNRIDLARIDQNIYNGRGRIRTFNHPNFTPNVQNALASITGVIFHITKSLGAGGAINESVKGVGSGTLVHFVPDGAGIPTIQNLVAGGNAQLNGILTCAHVLTSDDGESIEAYFVPSTELNLTFGLPNAINAIAIPGGATPNDLILFLRNNPNSFRITSYNLWQRHLGPGLMFALNNSMTATSPMYLDHEDMIVASITPNAGAILRNYNAPATVNFIRGGVAAAAAVAGAGAGINEYFSIGYPGCDQYDLTLAPLVGVFDQALTDELSFSPLFITKASIAQQGAIVVNNGQIMHKAPAAAGMSGGPLLMTLGNTVNIFGVITQGSDNDEVACNLE